MANKKKLARKIKAKLAILLVLIMVVEYFPEGFFDFTTLIARGDAAVTRVYNITSVAEYVELGKLSDNQYICENGEITSLNVTSADVLILLSNLNPVYYQNATITITNYLDMTRTASGYTFQGLGDEDYPFAGTIQVTDTQTQAAYLFLNTPLFYCVKASAQVGKVYLSSANTESESTALLLAESVVAGGEDDVESTWEVHIVSRTLTGTDDTTYLWSGLIGTLEKGAALKIQGSYSDEYSGGEHNNYQKLSGTDNIGLICNTMAEGASVTITNWTGGDGSELDYNIETKSGDAGTFIGSMGKNASLIVEPTITISTTVQSDSGNAGGIVGSASEGASIQLTNCSLYADITAAQAGGIVGAATDLEISGGTIALGASDNVLKVNGTQKEGGIAGSYTSSVDSLTLDTTPYTSMNIQLGTSSVGGGLFGYFENTKAGAKITISGEKDKTITVGDGTKKIASYGGIIGTYAAATLTDELSVENVTVSLSIKSNSSGEGVGGLIGTIKKNAYISLSDNSIALIGDTNLDTTTVGGLIHNAGSGSMVDIQTNTITTSGKTKVWGGLVKKITSGVIRIDGTVDLSDVNYQNANYTCGQIVAEHGNALVYKTTSGSIKHKASNVYVSNIGDYGDVVCLKKDVIEEAPTECAKGKDTELFYYDSKAHTVTVQGFDASDVDSARDFAALSVSIQAIKGDGALILFSDTTGVLEGNINLKADIKLEGCGITGLTRDDGTQTYSGILDGGGNTLTLDVGVRDGSYIGNGEIINHQYNGLFGKISDATIKNLTIAGTVNIVHSKDGVQNNSAGAYVGILAGDAEGNVTIEDVTLSSGLTLCAKSTHNISAGENPKVYVGGYIGATEESTTVWANTCTFSGSITTSGYSTGGFIGYLKGGNTVTFDKSKLESARISTNKSDATFRAGGVIGSTADSEKSNQININSLDILGTTISTYSGDNTEGTAGGFLGYRWYNTNVTIQKLAIGAADDTNSTLTVKNKVFGGLVYQASGYWKVGGDYDGITLSNTTFTGKSEDTNPSALLIAHGEANKGKALYLELGLNNEGELAYTVGSVVTLELTGQYFDEIVGKSSGSEGNGVVSIATKNHDKIDTESCNTYTAQLLTTDKNKYTRYYYNLDAYRDSSGDNGKSTVALNNITDGETMLLWSVYQYADSSIQQYFATGSNNIIGGTDDNPADIDLTGYSYYPVDISSSVTISNATITFAYDSIVKAEETNKMPSEIEQQHYLMHCGLFYNVTATTENDINIEGNNITLQGEFGVVSESEGSGVLVCGTVEGNQNVTKGIETTATIKLTDVKLAGIKIASYDGSSYAPLLINYVNKSAKLNFDTLYEVSDKYGGNTKIASSLVGKVGDENAYGIGLDFANIQLDSHEDTALFAHATFLESFQYAEDSYGTYNFNKGDEYVTYGRELSNSASGSVSGRNNDLQYYYYGTENYVQDDDKETENNADSAAEYFATGYLRYVCQPEDQDGNYELDINQKWASLTDGCGTYGDPYIITDGAQLETVAKILDGRTGNVQIQVDKSLYDNSKLTDFTGSATADLHTADEVVNNTHTKDVEIDSNLIYYLANAYYVIDTSSLEKNQIELSGGFVGIGTKGNNLQGAFCGVIIGKAIANADDNTETYPTIVISVPTSSQTTYGGLVRYAAGCVIKNLNIEYDGDTITMTKSTSNSRGDDAFFGGVIGYAMAGDNIIDNVNVTWYPTIDTDNNLIAVGGYVGQIGGGSGSSTADKAYGGGVVFRNMADKNAYSKSNGLYQNPYVGRVLDGYACSEGVELKNTNNNYTIATLDTDRDSKLSITGTEITVADAQQLWVLSAIVNSGAGAQGEIAAGTSYAYSYGKVRGGNYNNVGKKDDTATSEVKSDETYWGGKECYKVEKTSYLIKKYVTSGQEENFSILTTDTSTYQLNFSKEETFDMTNYGNGFRGIGAAYQDNAYDNIKYRDLPLNKITGNNATVILDRQVQEYTNESWWVQCLGLFPSIYFKGSSGISVSNLTIQGKVTISYTVDNTNEVEGVSSDAYIGECSAGGFAGMTANGSCSKTVTLSNMKLDNLTVTGAKYAGGFIAVIGQSSRTMRSTKTFTKQISNTVGSYVFSECSYTDLTITGGYSAGGFAGISVNSGTFTVKGDTTMSASTVKLSGDAGKDIITNATQTCEKITSTSSKIATDDAKINGYSGAGGILGYSNKKVSIAETGSVTASTVTVSSVQICFNVDYGIGGLVGTNLAETVIKNVEMDSCIVKTDIDENFKGAFTKDTKYYMTMPAGGVVGQVTKTGLTLESITSKNCQVLDCGYTGGLCGRNAVTATISNCTVENLTVYSQGTASYNGPVMVGGLVARPDGQLTVTNTVLKNVTVFSDGYSGGIAGANRSDIILTNVTMDSCKVVTDNVLDIEKDRYFLTAKTDPSSSPTSAKGGYDANETKKGVGVRTYASTHGCAGGITGDFTYKAKYTITGYNVLIKDTLIGYYVDDNGTKVENGPHEHKVASTALANMKEKNIAVIKSNGEYVPYKDATFSSTEHYNNGYDGIIIGDKTDSQESNLIVKIVGLSVTGSYVPYEYNGGTSYSTTNTEYGTDGYVIRSDYTKTVSKNLSDGAVGDVVKNPNTTTGGLTVYSDGAVLANSTPVGQTIFNDLLTNSISSNLTYRFVTDYASYFAEKGDYEGKISSYSELESDYPTENDFSVLLIETSSESTLNDEIYKYITLLTDFPLTKDSAVIRNITVTAYGYQATDGTTKQWTTANVTPSLKCTNKVFSFNKGQYDNGQEYLRFMMVDVQLSTNTNDTNVYHLNIPVYVKKILEFDCNVVVDDGTKYYEDAYYPMDTESKAIAGNDDQVTALIEYKYQRGCDEWLELINAGDNFLWNYPKEIHLADKASSLPTNTKLYLVDANNGGKTYYIENSAAGENNTLAFKEMKSVSDNTDLWSAVYLSDLLAEQLELVAKEDENGSMVECTKTDGVFRLVTDEGTYQYYRLVTDKDAADVTKYSINSNLSVDAQKKIQYISEKYYLTIQMEVESLLPNSIYYQTGTLPKSGVTGEIPTMKIVINSATQNAQYVFGEYVTQAVEVSAADEIFDTNGTVETIMDSDNATIYAVMTSTMTLDSKAEQYISNKDAWQNFELYLKKQEEGEKTSSLTGFVSGTYIQYEIYSVKDKTEDVLLYSGDYTTDGSESSISLEPVKVGSAIADGRTIELRAKIKFPTNQISEQFPLDETNQGEIGVLVCGQSNLAYVSASLDSSSVENQLGVTTLKESMDGVIYFYRQTVSNAKLTYNTYTNGQATGTTGDFAQLGTNPSDPDRNYLIYTNGYYDVSDVSESILKDAKYIQYTFNLYQKTDKADGSVSYVNVASSEDADMDQYITDIRYSDDLFATVNSTENIFEWTQDNQDAAFKDIEIMLKVVTGSKKANTDGSDGSDFEENELYYANYRLELIAVLLDENKKPLEGTEATDAIIYTNARVNYEFVDYTASDAASGTASGDISDAVSGASSGDISDDTSGASSGNTSSDAGSSSGEATDD